MNIQFNKISVIGLGYIGLPTATMIASKGVTVIGVDVNEHIVNTVNAGKIHIVEPDLDSLVHDVVNKKLLRAVISPECADVFIITVPTPFGNEYEPDLSYVNSAVKSIVPCLQKGNLVILESTSPVGTTEQISHQLALLRPDLTFPHQMGSQPDIHIAYCPERVMPGKIIHELVENDRIIGGMTAKCAHQAASLYRLFVKGNCLTTEARTAEMTKLTENAFRDVNIAFANELSMICDKLKINVWELIRLANHHPRVNILQPGAGVGGHCIAVDPWFIVSAAPKESNLIRVAREVNDNKPKFVLEKIKLAITKTTHPVIACLGLSYKADTDDLRESPAMHIVHQLAFRSDHKLLIVEPNISHLPQTLALNDRCELVSLEKALELANIIVLLVNHKEFIALNKKVFSNKTIINIVNEQQWSSILSTSLKEPVL